MINRDIHYGGQCRVVLSCLWQTSLKRRPYPARGAISDFPGHTPHLLSRGPAKNITSNSMDAHAQWQGSKTMTSCETMD